MIYELRIYDAIPGKLGVHFAQVGDGVLEGEGSLGHCIGE